MRVFMCGWEFPPFISGGLGTACQGLTRALSRQNVQIVFVLPKAVGIDYPTHVRLLSAKARAVETSGPAGQPTDVLYFESQPGLAGEASGSANVSFRAVPSGMRNPYQSAGGRFHPSRPHAAQHGGGEAGAASEVWSVLDGPGGDFQGSGLGVSYQGDLISESQRYAQMCVGLAKREEFDVIHAHDWMTFPAGMAVAAATGKPLVVHVHSTEFDRSGENINQRVYDIERRGMHGAMRVVAVSHMTKSILQHRYGVDGSKISVVYNGIENGAGHPVQSRVTIKKADRIVLFLGRITMQKGPEYFVNAAKKVLEKVEHVKFVMAGTGDMIREIIELAAAQGIGHKVLFTGFLHGRDVERIFSMADVYVMPSVSEPFGIAPLEAVSHDVPVIISKTSGVAEVLTHALKVDFWDTHEIANKIIAVLRHPPLSATLREHADMEVRRLTWDDAATKCRKIYDRVLGAMPV